MQHNAAERRFSGDRNTQKGFLETHNSIVESEGKSMAVFSFIVIMFYLFICAAAVLAVIAAVLGIGGVGLLSFVSGIVMAITGKRSEHSSVWRVIGTVLLIFGVLALAAFGGLAYLLLR